MSKVTVVNINERGGRVYVNTAPPSTGENVTNPNMALVVGVPPQYWVLEKGIVRPMTVAESNAKGLPPAPPASDRPAFAEDQKKLRAALGSRSSHITNLFHKLRYSLRNRKLLQCLLSFAVGALVSALLLGN